MWSISCRIAVKSVEQLKKRTIERELEEFEGWTLLGRQSESRVRLL